VLPLQQQVLQSPSRRSQRLGGHAKAAVDFSVPARPTATAPSATTRNLRKRAKMMTR
jgi:hypothetical protein